MVNLSEGLLSNFLCYFILRKLSKWFVWNRTLYLNKLKSIPVCYDIMFFKYNFCYLFGWSSFYFPLNIYSNQAFIFCHRNPYWYKCVSEFICYAFSHYLLNQVSGVWTKRVRFILKEFADLGRKRFFFYNCSLFHWDKQICQHGGQFHQVHNGCRKIAWYYTYILFLPQDNQTNRQSHVIGIG